MRRIVRPCGEREPWARDFAFVIAVREPERTTLERSPRSCLQPGLRSPALWLCDFRWGRRHSPEASAPHPAVHAHVPGLHRDRLRGKRASLFRRTDTLDATISRPTAKFEIQPSLIEQP